jgi:hypothetical protein
MLELELPRLQIVHRKQHQTVEVQVQLIQRIGPFIELADLDNNSKPVMDINTKHGAERRVVFRLCGEFLDSDEYFPPEGLC